MSTHNYELSEIRWFWVACEGCGISTPPDDDDQVAEQMAEGLGFISAHTPEDGTINLCAKCSTELISSHDAEQSK